MKTALAIITLIILCGCQTFYTNIVTITQVRKSAITEMASLYKKGLVSPETDKKFEAIDEEYIRAANIAEHALIAYKEGLAAENPEAKILAVKVIVGQLLDVITPMLLEKNAKKLNAQLSTATQL
jgi:phosphoenolpyruvate synthase/pyruvate phosphate dikinase